MEVLLFYFMDEKTSRETSELAQAYNKWSSRAGIRICTCLPGGALTRSTVWPLQKAVQRSALELVGGITALGYFPALAGDRVTSFHWAGWEAAWCERA